MTTNIRIHKKPLLILGNWKMNPQREEAAVKLFTEINKAIRSKKQIQEIGVAAPYVFISSLSRIRKNSPIALGAQDVAIEQSGPFTGEISAGMLKNIGVGFIIVGHSERRAKGENDEQVRSKTQTVLKAGLTAVVCIGEKVRDKQGDYFSFVQSQMKSLLHGVPQSQLKRLVIAYEPIWAIGTGVHATPEDVQEMKLFIQKCLADHYGRAAVNSVRIIYGGSVTKDNAQELLEGGNADGFLVGGASLKSAEFIEIIHISNTYAHA